MIKKASTGILLRQIKVTDNFWKHYMELVRNEVIPYQWEALNDRIEGAPPSYCMRNFKLAGHLTEVRKKNGKDSTPVFPTDRIECLPESFDKMEDRAYGFLFQDTDFSKWIEAVGYSLAQHQDTELEKIADAAIDIVCAAQQEDGYLDTFYIINNMDERYTNLRDNHEMYCFGHLAEGAIAYYQATGKDKLLQAAKRFADGICMRFGEEKEKCKGYPGHEIAEMALMRLYELTDKEDYKKLAKFFVDERGRRPYYFDKERNIIEKNPKEERYTYHQAHRMVREQKEAVGHAVRAVYLYSGMADVAVHTQDEELLQACETIWKNITGKQMYITGGIGATHHGEAFTFDYDLPNDTNYSETCASIGLVFFAKRMLEIRTKAEYADVMERALYNGVLSGMALDGKSFFYVNPMEANPKASKKDPGKKHVVLPRQKWFGCACCPPNIARLVSSIGTYAYSGNEDTLFMHLYVGGTIRKVIADTEVVSEVRSEYPWKGEVAITLRLEEEGAAFCYAVRIPGWCRDYRIEINKETAKYVIKDGYAYMEREWKNGDSITLHFDMQVQVYHANPKVRENVGKVAVVRGPIVYCLEEADNGSMLWGILVGEEPKFEETYREDFLGGVVVLTSKGKRRCDDWEENTLYCAAGSEQYQDTALTWIPYYAWCNRGAGEMMVWVQERG